MLTDPLISVGANVNDTPISSKDEFQEKNSGGRKIARNEKGLPMFTGRQIAFMIYAFVKINGVQGRGFGMNEVAETYTQKMRRKLQHYCGDSCHRAFKSGGSFQTIQRISSQRVRICNGRTTRILLIVQKQAGSRQELLHL